jgi:hypothetical protein
MDDVLAIKFSCDDSFLLAGACLSFDLAFIIDKAESPLKNILLRGTTSVGRAKVVFPEETYLKIFIYKFQEEKRRKKKSLH